MAERRGRAVRRVAAVRAVPDRGVVVTWTDGSEHTVAVGLHGPAEDVRFATVVPADGGGAIGWDDGSVIDAGVLWDWALTQDGERLARWRTARGLDRRQFAVALGLPLSAVRGYEAGRRPIPKTVKLALIGHDALARMAARRNGPG